jgi:peptidoglycan/xylan/chitin deacetylase (PgdA/CDA1 family)
MTKVALSGLPKNEALLLKVLLYPYRVELSGEEDCSDLTICRGTCTDLRKPQIRISGGLDAQRDHAKLEYHGNGIVELPSELISACSTRLETVRNPKIALTYALSTRLPFRYNKLPTGIRNRLLSTRMADIDLAGHFALETARRILLDAFALLGFRLTRKNPPSLLVTHDIETERGLRRAPYLKEIENDLGVKSTWFVPSHDYPIDRTIAAKLADNSVIGSHDIKHDGQLIQIRKRSKLVERLMASRQRLGEIFGQEVRCFRAPLLQFSSEILSALKEAGYSSDFSLPCWEMIYPPTMSGFGIECVQAFEMEEIVETPLTMFQDHQLLNLMGMNFDEAIKLWLEQARLIRSFEGDHVLLIHPDYSFSQELGAYKRLLISLLELNSRSDHSPALEKSSECV